MNLREQSVLERIDALADEMLAFLQGLVAIPTVNPPGDNYVPCAEYIGAKLREFCYDVSYIHAEGRPEHTAAHPRCNVMGSLRSAAQNRPCLHFNGHFDVVPVGDGWTVDPFGGIIRDKKIYGRGVTDQKAGIAASIFAIEAIRRAGANLSGRVEQSATVDEESGGFAGMAYLAGKGLVHRDRTDFVIITEPLNVDRVCLGHRGVYWFEVAVKGHIAHGSMPFLGVNAISKMAGFLSLIESELKPLLAQRHTAMPVEPPAARSPSLNVNAISGGQPIGEIQSPCVADSCHAILDRRFIIEEPSAQVRSEIVQILEKVRRADPEFRYQLNDLLTVEPVLTDSNCPLVTTLSSAIHSVRRTQPPLIASPGTYDQKHVMRLGFVEQCVAYGPGLLHMAHQPDEYCEIDHLIDATKTMALTAIRLLGTT
jgi:succinyl-diaminopimelate desuccinylase